MTCKARDKLNARVSNIPGPSKACSKNDQFCQACYSHVVGVVVRCNRMKVAKTVEAPFNEAVVNNDLCRMVGTLEPEEVNEN